MNNAAMTFDAGTWWLIGLLVTALIGAVVFLVKRTLFSRMNKSTISFSSLSFCKIRTSR